MTLIPEGYAQVTFTFNNAGAPRPAQVTFGINQPNDLDPDEVLSILNDAALADLVQLTCVNAVVLSNIHVKFGPVDTGPFADAGVAIAGAQGSDPPPSQTALNVVKNTATGGRRGRGRMFWPGYPESTLQLDGSFNSGALDQYNDAFEDWRSFMDGNACTLVLLHQSGAPTPATITSLRVQSRPATQRRRNRRI